MKNKVLVKIIVPEFEESYDVFIPVNEVIWKLKKMIIKCISDLAMIEVGIDTPCVLINKYTNTMYDNNDIVINTDIRNGSEIIILFE